MTGEIFFLFYQFQVSCSISSAAEQKQNFSPLTVPENSASIGKSVSTLPDLTQNTGNKAIASWFNPNYNSDGCSTLTPNLKIQSTLTSCASNLVTPIIGAAAFGGSSCLTMTPPSGSEKGTNFIHSSNFLPGVPSDYGNHEQLKRKTSIGVDAVTAKLPANPSNTTESSRPTGLPKVGQLLSGSVMDILKGDYSLNAT